jgi:hypothetical protein
MLKSSMQKPVHMQVGQEATRELQTRAAALHVAGNISHPARIQLLILHGNAPVIK